MPARDQEQASKQRSKQTSKQTSKQANKQTGKQVNKQTSKHANKQTSKQANRHNTQQQHTKQQHTTFRCLPSAHCKNKQTENGYVLQNVMLKNTQGEKFKIIGQLFSSSSEQKRRGVRAFGKNLRNEIKKQIISARKLELVRQANDKCCTHSHHSQSILLRIWI